MSPSSPTVAATPSAEAEQIANQLALDLMSPYCPGRTIATCPSPQARTLEREILTMAEEGQTREEIEGDLVARFPDIQGYLGRPELLYGLLGMALMAIVMIAFISRRWLRQGQRAGKGGRAGQPAGARVSDRERDALDDALDKVDAF